MTGKKQHTEQLETLRNWLIINRKARHITMRTVANRMKVSHSWVAKTESGERRLEIQEFANLCLAMGLDPHEGLDLLIAGQPSYPRLAQESMLAAEPPPRYGTKAKRAKK
jgi:transcriptional regulator with XRE-family HTH domain